MYLIAVEVPIDDFNCVRGSGYASEQIVRTTKRTIRGLNIVGLPNDRYSKDAF